VRQLTLIFASAVTQTVTVDENSVLLSPSAQVTDAAVSCDAAFNCDGLLAGSYPSQILDRPVILLRDRDNFQLGVEYAPGTNLYCTINSGVGVCVLQLIFDQPTVE